MPEASNLTKQAVDLPEAELQDSRVHDGASGPKDEVRCVIAEEDGATDPMPFTPFVTHAGVFYPKRGDRAILGFPENGPPVILWWQPQATEPDVAF